MCSIGCVFVRDDTLETSGVGVKDVLDDVSTAGESEGESGLSSENVNAVARGMAGDAAPCDHRSDAARGGDVAVSEGLLEAKVTRREYGNFDGQVSREVFKTCVGCAVCGDADAGGGFYGSVGTCSRAYQ